MTREQIITKIINKKNQFGWKNDDYFSDYWEVRVCCHQALGIKWELIKNEHIFFMLHFARYIDAVKNIIFRKVTKESPVTNREHEIILINCSPKIYWQPGDVNV